jgi:hypothetical protein
VARNSRNSIAKPSAPCSMARPTLLPTPSATRSNPCATAHPL